LNVKDKDSERLISTARRELGRAEEKLRGNQLYAADRLQAASDAFMHAAEHSVHLDEGPKGPVPQATEIADHLQRVYFRLQQADFFAGSSGETDAKALPALARRFYEQARKAYDSGSWFVADEYAKSADDTIRGLENLPQAAVPEPPRPPGPRWAMNNFFQRRLQLQLLLILLAGVAVAALSVLLIWDSVRAAERVVISDIGNQLNSAIAELCRQYAYRAESDTNWQSLTLVSQNISLRGISQTVLRSYPGVEGGFFSDGKFVGYAFPTHDNPSAKTDVPVNRRCLTTRHCKR
jgi:hypothetical protein